MSIFQIHKKGRKKSTHNDKIKKQQIHTQNIFLNLIAQTSLIYVCSAIFFPPKEQQKSIQPTICPKDILQKLPLVNKHHYKYSMLLHGLGSDTKKKLGIYLNFHFLYLRNRTTLEVCCNLRSFFFSFFPSKGGRIQVNFFFG